MQGTEDKPRLFMPGITPQPQFSRGSEQMSPSPQDGAPPIVTGTGQSAGGDTSEDCMSSDTVALPHRPEACVNCSSPSERVGVGVSGRQRKNSRDLYMCTTFTTMTTGSEIILEDAGSAVASLDRPQPNVFGPTYPSFERCERSFQDEKGGLDSALERATSAERHSVDARPDSYCTDSQSWNGCQQQTLYDGDQNGTRYSGPRELAWTSSSGAAITGSGGNPSNW